LSITESIIDAGLDPGDDLQSASSMGIAVGGASAPIKGWGPECQVLGATILGGMRVESIMGRGGIWTHSLRVHDNQKG
jgi:hypothetical protein